MARISSFSERQGFSPPLIIQLDGCSPELRTGLWNVLHIVHQTLFARHEVYRTDGSLFNLFAYYWSRLSLPVDGIPQHANVAGLELKSHILNAKWHEVYDFIEYVVNAPVNFGEDIGEKFNGVLEQHFSGYRFLNKQLVPICSTIELQAIETALKNSGVFSGPRMHLEAAMTLLSDRASPDFRNSVKESISAVESMCQCITGNPKATLGMALQELKAQGVTHPALLEAFSKIYGYTSDENGIRHASIKDSNVDCAEATFMLIACSAFINFVTSKFSS